MPDATGYEDGVLRELRVDQIERNPDQPRRRFDQTRLTELATSIQSTDGILEPLIVRPSGTRYQLIAGERRWRASVLAGRTTVPAIVRDVDKVTAFAMSTIENMVREDLTPIEEARSVATLCETHGLSKAEIARRVGRTREAISNLVRLLELPEPVLELVDDGSLSEGHGRALLLCHDHFERIRLARRAVADGWSVRRLERAARGDPGDIAQNRGAWHPDQLAFASELEDAVRLAINRDVDVTPHPDGYEITLRVVDLDDAARLLKRLGGTGFSP